ncbi:MAG: HD domain-containing protein, partial [SAR202 cluster bacterium]|nr:HD domain-containing protein [SAR202 cluster bacterium]
EKNLIYVCSGALLHDIGKIWIPTSILDKEDDLDPFEKQILYEHSCNGFMMLQSLEYDVVNQIVLGHHGFKDFYDDQGNVRLHKPDKIDPVVLFLTKIVSVADAYDALSHERSYKPALLPDEINPLLNDLFKDDPELVEMVMNMDD